MIASSHVIMNSKSKFLLSKAFGVELSGDISVILIDRPMKLTHTILTMLVILAMFLAPLQVSCCQMVQASPNNNEAEHACCQQQQAPTNDWGSLKSLDCKPASCECAKCANVYISQTQNQSSSKLISLGMKVESSIDTAAVQADERMTNNRFGFAYLHCTTTDPPSRHSLVSQHCLFLI